MIFLASKMAKLSSFFLTLGKWATALYLSCAWWMDPFILSLTSFFFVVGWNGTSYHLWLSFLLLREHQLLKRQLSYAYSKELKSYQLHLPHRCQSSLHVFKSGVSNDSFVDSLPFLILTPGGLNSLSAGKSLIYLHTFPFSVPPSQVRWFCDKEQGSKSL